MIKEEKEDIKNKIKLNAKKEFDGKTDEEINLMAREGNDDAVEFLLNKYKPFARSKARSYYIVGADKEDIIQEGMIGLYKAIRDYRADKLCSFRAFAELCITRQIITAIKSATRQKHTFLNTYVSLNKPVYDDVDKTVLDMIANAKTQNPEDIVIDRENFNIMEDKIWENLSALEKQVLKLYLDGRSYNDIAAELDKSVKTVDNALQRIKTKLNKIL